MVRTTNRVIGPETKEKENRDKKNKKYHRKEKLWTIATERK